MKRFFDRIFPSTERHEGPFPAAGLPAATAGRSCSECGASASPVQDWCLECGSRIEDTATRWHQPAAVMASVALIFVAGLVLALSEVAKDAEIAKAKTVRKMVAAAPPPAAQIPDVPTPQGVPTLKTPVPPKTSKNDTDDKGPKLPSPSSDSGSSAGAADPSAAAVPSTGPSAGPYVPPAATPAPVARWPVKTKAYTVVLLSATSKSQAEKFARKAQAKGIEAGILDGGKYKNQTTGVWLVWAGRFKTEQAALKAADGYAKKGFDGESTEYIRKKSAGDDGADKGDSDKDNVPSLPAPTSPAAPPSS